MIGPDETHDSSCPVSPQRPSASSVPPVQCPSMGVAQLGTQGWRSAPMGFRTSTSYHSCCRYTLLLLTFLASNFLLKTFLAAIQRLSKEKSCCSLPRGLPRPRWFFGVNILSTSSSFTGNNFFCKSTSNTAATTFWWPSTILSLFAQNCGDIGSSPTSTTGSIKYYFCRI